MLETIKDYQPCVDRRFAVSKDPFSKERCSALDKTIQKLKIALPYFAGATLFGSLSKGKVLTEKTAPKTDLDLSLFFDSESLGAFLKVREDRQPSGEISHEPLVTAAVRKATAWITKYCPSLSEDKIEVHPYYISRREDSLGSIEHLLKKSEASETAAPFAFDIGKGLLEYQQAWLRRLKKPEWEEVDRSVRFWERNYQIPPNLENDYPKELFKALVYYR